MLLVKNNNKNDVFLILLFILLVLEYSLLFLLDLFVFYVYECLPECMYVYYMHAHGGQKRTLDSLEVCSKDSCEPPC